MRPISPLFLPLLILAGLSTLALFFFVPRKSDTAVQLGEIRVLLDSIPVYPSAREVDSYWSNKLLHTGVGKYYQADIHYEDLKNYYLDRLKPLGWCLTSEKPVKDWWRDLGGRELTFEQGNYILVLQFAGEKANYGWNYSISINSTTSSSLASI
jgi:hypothetical protein